MKKYLVVIYLCTGMLAAAQDPAYTGPAKIYVKSFWSQVEKLKAGNATASTISNAERAIKNIKEADKHYNTADMEAILKPFKEKADKEQADEKAAGAKAADERQYYNNLWQELIGVYSKGNDIEPGATGKAYYERMQKINLAAYQQKKQEGHAAEAGRLVEMIDEILADYDNYVERSERLRWNVTEVMNKSRYAANPQQRMELLEAARYECEAVLMLSPGNTAFKKKLEDINKLIGGAASEAAKFFTSDFHKAHLNTIVWSTSPLVIGKEKDAAASIKTEFKTGDNIYGTAYLGVLAKDAMENNTNLRVRIRIDGGTAIWGGDLSYIEVPASVQNQSYIQFALLPDAQWLREAYAPYLAEENWTLSYLLDELARSGDISHEISCELIFPTSRVRDIKSKFSLDLGGGTVAIIALATQLHNQLMNSRQLPRAGMNNPAMERELLGIMQKLPGWSDHFNKAIITSSSWSVTKNELTGLILYRYISVTGTCTDAAGTCYTQEFTFRQDYSGGGNYESKLKYNSYGGKREIGCDKIK